MNEFNQFNNPNQNQQNFGFQGGQSYIAQRKPKYTNPLTDEDKKQLKNTGGFTLYVGEKDIKRAICTHKDGDKFSLTKNSDDSHTCWICGATFNLVEDNKEDIKIVTQRFIDTLQSIKTYFLDIPEGTAREFFQMIPFIEKTPDIYELAVNNFNSYEQSNTQYMSPSRQNWELYNSINQPMNLYPQMQQPMYQQQQPMYQQQQPMYQQSTPVPQGAQPVGQFGYVDNGMPVGSTPVMQTQQQQFTPMSPIPQQQGERTADETIQQTKTFNL